MEDTLQNRNKRIARNTVALYIRMAVTMVVSFFSVRVTMHVLGSEDYGLNNLVASIVTMFSFINGSMGTAVQRFYALEIGKGDKARLSKVFGVGMFLHIIVALITFLIGEIFAVFFLHMLNIPPERMFAAHVVFQISLFQLLLTILNVPYTSMLRARESFDKMAIMDICQALGRLVVLYVLTIIPFDKLISLSCLNLLITVFYVSAIVLLCRKFPETRFHIDKDKALIKEMTSFVSMLLFTVLASLLRDKGVAVLINLFFGLIYNTAYGIASQMMGFANTFALSFKQAIVPQLVSAYSAGDRKRMNDLINWGTKISFILLLMITLPIIVEPHFFLDIILVDVPEHASAFTVLLMININLSSFSFFLYQGVHATGRIKGQQISTAILYFMNILLMYVVFKLNEIFDLGLNCYTGLYVTIGCSVVQCIINMFYAHRTFGFDLKKFIPGSVLKSIVVAAVCVVPPIFVRRCMEESWGRFLAVTAVVEVVLLGISYFFYLTPPERKKVMALIKGFFGKFNRNHRATVNE